MTMGRGPAWAGVAVFCLLATPGVAGAQTGAIPFDGPGWSREGDLRVEAFQGTTVLAGNNGEAVLSTVRLGDGEIAFDMMVQDVRSFVYVTFRRQGAEGQEEIYFRPHKSGLPDAVQYAAVFQRSSGWQLYHDSTSTANVPLPPDTWIPVRLVVSGSDATLYVGHGPEPALRMRLRGGFGPGSVGLRSFVPGTTAAGTTAARFANLRVTPGKTEGLIRAAPASAPPGTVGAWEVSPALDPAEAASVPAPPRVPAEAWTRVDADPTGLVNLDRFVQSSSAGKRVATRLTLRSPDARTVAFDLGFSDDAVVFVNGRPLFSGTQRYSYNSPRRDGLIGLDTRLYLPLRAGDNELLVVVTDYFGGWGVMGRLEPDIGVTVSAPR